MPSLNASKWGYIQGPQNATFSTANGASSGTATANPTNATTAIEYRYQGRTTLVHSMRRSFFYFDTTSITVAPTSATLDLLGNTIVSDTAIVIVVRSTAFSGDGSTDLSNDDFSGTMLFQA